MALQIFNIIWSVYLFNWLIAGKEKNFIFVPSYAFLNQGLKYI